MRREGDEEYRSPLRPRTRVPHEGVALRDPGRIRLSQFHRPATIDHPQAAEGTRPPAPPTLERRTWAKATDHNRVLAVPPTEKRTERRQSFDSVSRRGTPQPRITRLVGRRRFKR